MSISSSTMIPKHESSRVLAIRRCTDVHIHYVTEVAEYVVQQVEMPATLL